MSGCEHATLSEPVFSNVTRMPLLIPRRRTHRAMCRADMPRVAIEHYLPVRPQIKNPQAPWGQGQDAEKRRSKLWANRVNNSIEFTS